MNAIRRSLFHQHKRKDTIMFKVYYAAVPAQPILFHVDQPFSVGLLPVTHRFVCELDVPRRENVFAQMQGEVWSPNGEARELIASLGLHHTSMSVGDVVQDDDGVHWMCADLGWQRLPDALTQEQRDSLLAVLSDEIKHLCERGVPFTGTELAIGELLIVWRDAVNAAAGDGQ
jgi:hypothetical protein